MVADELFGDLPEQAKPRGDAAALGAPRLREPQRDQIELRAVDIESLIGEDHLVRVIWSYVEGLDLSELENRIKARRARSPGDIAAAFAGAVALCHQRRCWQCARFGAAV